MNEESYFQSKNNELLDNLRQQEKIRRQKEDLSRVLKTHREFLLDEITVLGFSSETAPLIWLIPLVYVAWSDDSVSEAEEEFILQFGSVHGMLSNQASRNLCRSWLRERPTADFFDRCHTLLGYIYRDLPWREIIGLQSRLWTGCTGVADCSGGFLGFGSRISKAESRSIHQLEEAGLFGKKC
jgi:hypothetical protein